MAKTIVEKLNLQKFKKMAVLDVPEDADYFSDLETYDTELTPGDTYDVIFAFVLDMEALRELVDKIIGEKLLHTGGYIYLAYPKKGNKIYPSFIHRDELFDGLGADEEGYIGKSSLKFSRMAGLDEIFTVVGLKDTPVKNKSASKTSQSVGDYVELIPDVENNLQDTPELLVFYQSLTPGYKKDWARYVYSAKQEATRARRMDEMKMILGAGYKTRDLYRRDR
ncbi:YdeI/OmpD-associated family protein [Peribacillus kribbensis]|uniref:YdeI/OmpD-associated family protein n=1 Tax=Peribacillus kribbensis TaxID=356658 RepID=UPI00041F395A|nr:YdeI/OmpD-associated family protein [Peribacillus kribbensis]